MRRILVYLLLCSALCLGVVSLTINHTSRVRFHSGRSITLPCTKTSFRGVVQYWHTPFGQVRNSSLHFKDVVAMQQDGSLQIQNPTPYHSGLYYCLLLAGKHTTLTPYLLGQQDRSDKPRRVARSVLGSQAEERDALVLDHVFESAVVASVVVTFLVGFSFGALSRTLLDSLLLSLMNWVRSLGRGCRNHGETVQVSFRHHEEPEDDSSSLTIVTMENDNSLPPAKPKRSFRDKTCVETTAYLKGCEQEREVKEKEKGDSIDSGDREREGGAGGIYSEKGSKRNDGEEKNQMEEGSEEKGRSKCEEETERRGSEEGRVWSEKGKGRIESEEGKERIESEEGKERSECEEGREKGESEVRKRENTRTETKGNIEEKGSSSSSGGASETGSARVRDGGEEIQGAQRRSVTQPARRSRVIRLYQYDEDGHRYGHLPNPIPTDHPTPQPRQRSLSLNRLSTIMAAATASPLDPTSPPCPEPGRDQDDPVSSTQRQERAVFQLGM